MLRLYAGLMYVFLYLPIAILVLFSFNKDRINAVWTGFTLDWYRRLWDNSDLLMAFEHSLLIAFFSAAIATLLGIAVAYSMYKFDFPGKRLLSGLLQLPILTPDLITAIGLLSFFILIKFTLGLLSILIGHITFNIAFVAVILKTRFEYLDQDLENAARDLGASQWQAFRHAILPDILPGAIAGFLVAFTLSWDDFVIAFFNSGVGATTFPVKVYSMIKLGANPQINAISTLVIFVSFLMILLSLRFQKLKNLLQ